MTIAARQATLSSANRGNEAITPIDNESNLIIPLKLDHIKKLRG